MSRDVIMSIHPEWIYEIFAGKKTIEVRKRAPLQHPPFKVYVYCTKGADLWFDDKGGIPLTEDPLGPFIPTVHKINGYIVGEFTCERIRDMRPPFKGKETGTCLSAKELYKYMGSSDHLDYIEIKDLVFYDIQKKLEDFGLTRPPQSWCYVKETT